MTAISWQHMIYIHTYITYMLCHPYLSLVCRQQRHGLDYSCPLPIHILDSVLEIIPQRQSISSEKETVASPPMTAETTIRQWISLVDSYLGIASRARESCYNGSPRKKELGYVRYSNPGCMTARKWAHKHVTFLRIPRIKSWACFWFHQLRQQLYNGTYSLLGMNLNTDPFKPETVPPLRSNDKDTAITSGTKSCNHLSESNIIIIQTWWHLPLCKVRRAANHQKEGQVFYNCLSHGWMSAGTSFLWVQLINRNSWPSNVGVVFSYKSNMIAEPANLALSHPIGRSTDIQYLLAQCQLYICLENLRRRPS